MSAKESSLSESQISDLSRPLVSILKEFYKRDIIQLNDKDDYDIFEKYVKKHPIFVKKPINLSFGKGIALVDSKDYKTHKILFNELLKEAPVIIEEQIISDDTMASLHPESLNTVRIITYRDKNNNVHRFSPNEIIDQIILYN